MRLPLRGGNWNNGSNVGLGSLNLNNERSNSNSNIGFFPALGKTPESEAFTDLRPVHCQTGPYFLGDNAER
jgi:hypothetical protein